MFYICLAEAAVLVVTITVFAGLLRSKERAHARREDLLLNQLLHAVGRPWQSPPSDAPGAAGSLDDYENELPEWSAAPEQLPVY